MPKTEEEVRKVFHEFDKNKNGVLEMAEIKQLLTRANIQLTSSEFESLVKYVDSSRDGLIQFEELLRFLSSRQIIM